MTGKNNNGKTMKCSHCGTEVEVSQGSSGCSVSCCGEPMKAAGGGGQGGSSAQQKGHGK